MGTLLLKKKQRHRALKAFENAVKEDPDYAAAHLRLAELYEATGKEEEAAQARARAAELGTGVAQRDADGPAEGSAKEVAPASAAQSSRSREAQPQGNAARYVRMGNLLLKKQMPSQAIDVFQKAVERDPEYREAYLGLAEALEAEGRTDEAEQTRAAAAALEPSSLGSDSEVSKGRSSE
jgi:Tfp pilus assembly protein PilF